MATDLGRLVATLEARAERFDLTLQRANANLDNLARQTEQANARMARSSAALTSVLGAGRRALGLIATAGAAAGASMAAFAAKQFAALDRLGDLAQQTGLAASELRLYQAALEQSGGSAELAAEGILTFTRNLGQAEAGTGRFAAFLKKLDPAFLENVKNADSTSEALALVADRIGGARNEQEKLALATAAFGSAGRQFVLLMADGAAGVAELRGQFEALGVAEGFDELVPKVQRLDDALKDLQRVTTDQFVAGFFGVGEGLGSIDERVSDPQFQQNLGTIAHGIGELGAKAIEAGVGLAELFTGLRTFDTLDLDRQLADARTALQDFDRGLAQRGIDPGRGLEGGEALAIGPGAFGPPQAGAASPQHAEAIRLLSERARLLEVVGRLERELALVTPHARPSTRGASAMSSSTPGAHGSSSRAEGERDELALVLRGFREEQAALDQLVARREQAADQITAAWRTATLDRMELLEIEREAALRELDALFHGADAQAAELRARVNATFDARAEEIVTPFEETLGKLGELGNQVFDDVLEGIAQGADATAEEMFRAFALGFAKIELEALRVDLGALLSGEDAEASSLTGRALEALGGVASPADVGQDQAAAQAALESGLESGAQRAGDVLLGAFGQGVSLLEAGGGALTEALGAGGQLVLAAIEAGAAALAAVSSATVGFLGLAEGGVVVGEAGTERIFGLSDVPKILARAGGKPQRAAQLAMQLGERVSTPQVRNLDPGTLVVPDRKLAPFFAQFMPRAALADGGAVLPLDRVGFAGQGVAESAGGGSGFQVNLNLTNNGQQPLQVRNMRVQRRGGKVDLYAELSMQDTRSGGPGVKAIQQRFGHEPLVREP